MNYQKVLHPPSQYYSHQVFYENPEYIDEAESFIDTVSYSESDGFIGLPMVRAVPSYDIQELYMRNPLATCRKLPMSQEGRPYIKSQRAFTPEFIHDMKPRLPPHMKNQLRTSSFRNNSPQRQPSSSSFPHRSGSANNHPRPYTMSNRQTGVPFRSTPTIPVVSRMAIPKELAKGFINAYQTRQVGRSSTPIPHRNMVSTSEPATNYQENQYPDTSYQKPYPTGFSGSQDTNLILDHHRAQPSKCKEYPVIVECDGEVKKMNSEGDATGVTDVDDLDTIGRMAATLDVEETEKLSDKQKMEIREMSKFLKPRVPSSVQSLQERKVISRSESASDNQKGVIGNKENAKTLHISFRKSLDSILNQLESCESSLNAVRAKFSMCKNNYLTSGEESSKTNIQDDIFNLREIKLKLMNAGDEEDLEKERTEPVDVPEVKSDNTMTEDMSTDFESRVGSRGTILDDTAALDLHRSKSYIVNLIDRALSKELGTIPNGVQDKFQDLNPIKAIKRIEMHKRKEESNFIRKDDPDLGCETSSPSVKEEEPMYIKKLKQLRWGHFKHIQKEVKRLEDLERFLDQCGASDDVPI